MTPVPGGVISHELPLLGARALQRLGELRHCLHLGVQVLAPDLALECDTRQQHINKDKSDAVRYG